MNFNKLICFLSLFFWSIFFLMILQLPILIITGTLLALVKNEWCSEIFLIIAESSVFAFLLYFLHKKFFRLPGSENSYGTSRTQTIASALLCSVSMNLLLFVIFRIINEALFNTFWFLFILIPLVGIIIACMKPQPYSKKMDLIVYSGLAISIIFSSFALLLLVLGGSPIEYKGDDPTEITGLISKKRVFPFAAKNIIISGRTSSFNMTCDVSEANFLEFAKQNGYTLAKDDPTYNANPETNSMKIDCSTMLPLPDQLNLPKPFYYYNFRYRNNGGTTMLYSIKEQKMYYHYSAR